MALELSREAVAGLGEAPGSGRERGFRGPVAKGSSMRPGALSGARSRPLSPQRNVAISCSKRVLGTVCLWEPSVGSSHAFLASYTSRISLAKNLENGSDVPARILLSVFASAFKNDEILEYQLENVKVMQAVGYRPIFVIVPRQQK